MSRYRFGISFDYGSFRMPERFDDPSGPTVFSPELWDLFLRSAVEAFHTEPITDRAKSWAGSPHVWWLAETPRFGVGVDISRDPAWLYVSPKVRELRSGALRPYRVEREVGRALRRLVKSCPSVTFTDSRSSV